jgi:hypothetical protein
MGPGMLNAKISQTLSLTGMPREFCFCIRHPIGPAAWYVTCDYDDVLRSRCHFVAQNRRNITIIGAALLLPSVCFGGRHNWYTKILRNPLCHQNEEVRMLGTVSLIILGPPLLTATKQHEDPSFD